MLLFYTSPEVYTIIGMVSRCYCGADSNNVFVIDSDGSLYKCWDDIGHILSSHTEQNFIQNTFGKELVVHILHDHITEFQSFFSGIVLALILHRSFEVLFQSA